jgi:hypothetical protein
MIESGPRSVTGRGTLAHIAGTLAILPHVLGIAGPDDADFAAMLAFGTSVIRLVGIAGHSGRAVQVLARAGEERTAETMLTAAISDATALLAGLAVVLAMVAAATTVRRDIT